MQNLCCANHRKSSPMKIMKRLLRKSWHNKVSTDFICLHPWFIARLPDGETETNPIDRIVAHLLFHRPPELPGKHSEASESPCSTKMQNENRTAYLANVPETFTNKQSLVHQESKVYLPLIEPEQYKDSPCVDNSENASSIGLADSGTVAVESSQWTKSILYIDNKGNSFISLSMHVYCKDLLVMWSFLFMSANWIHCWVRFL